MTRMKSHVIRVQNDGENHSLGLQNTLSLRAHIYLYMFKDLIRPRENSRFHDFRVIRESVDSL